MKSIVNSFVCFCFFVACLGVFTSCNKDNSANSFSIIGPWGMISGTITNSDGTTDRYDSMGIGDYYEYREYKPDGTLIWTKLPSQEKEYGVYTFNSATRKLTYKFDGAMIYSNATVNIISATEMNVTTDWGSFGMLTQYFVKVK